MAVNKNLPKPPQKKPKPTTPQHVRNAPTDYLRGGKTKGHTVGEGYTAWNTYGQGKPDFGKGPGPGEPYHEVQKKVQKPLPGSQKPPWATVPGRKASPMPSPIPRKLPWRPPVKASSTTGTGGNSAWINAVRRRLQGVK